MLHLDQKIIIYIQLHQSGRSHLNISLLARPWKLPALGTEIVSGMFQLDICAVRQASCCHTNTRILHPKKQKSKWIWSIVRNSRWNVLVTYKECLLFGTVQFVAGIVTWNCATPPGGTGTAVRQVGQVRLTGDTLSLSPLSSEPVWNTQAYSVVHLLKHY